MSGHVRWIGRSFVLQEKLRAIKLSGGVEYLRIGTIVDVVGEKVMHVVTAEVEGRNQMIFADELKKCGHEPEKPGDSQQP